jgi:phosphoglycolate phosphatase-like HAD superfamily hydrolase
MIGDSGIDVQTGINAGVVAVFCSFGFNPLGPDDPEPAFVIDSFADLVRVVAGRIGA